MVGVGEVGLRYHANKLTSQIPSITIAIVYVFGLDKTAPSLTVITGVVNAAVAILFFIRRHNIIAI